MAEKQVDPESLLNRAKEQEKDYDWSSAAATYESLVKAIPDSDPYSKGEMSERIAYSLHRHAFKCSTSEEFAQRINNAIDAYSRAKERYGMLPELETKPYVLRCDAMIALEEYWRAPSVSEKKRQITTSWNIATKSMKEFERHGRFRELADTYLQLAFSGYISHSYSWDFSQRKAIVKDAMEIVDLVTDCLAHEKDTNLVARYLLNLSLISEYWGMSYANHKERSKYRKKATDLFNKAVLLSEESVACQLALPDSLGRSPLDTVTIAGLIERALGIFRKTGDLFSIGSALNELAMATYWRAGEFDTSDEQKGVIERAVGYAREASEIFSIISYRTPNWSGILWIEAPEVALYGWGAYFEGDLSKRREYALKCLEYTPKMVELAKASEYPDILSLAYWANARCTVAAAIGETSDNRKKEMLQSAVEFLGESSKIEETVDPGMLWDRGFTLCDTAQIAHELSLLASNIGQRRKEASAALVRQSEGIELLEDWMTQSVMDKTGDLITGRHSSTLGDWLQELHGLDGQESSLLKSRDAYCKASKHFEQGGHFSRAAESSWNAAKVSDSLGDHSKASDLFKHASDNYMKAIEKVPRLQEMYEDHAKYMSAWSEIELARQAHSRQEYGKARDHYEKAAKQHESTARWKHLASNYLAWGQVENAEDLSQRERCKETIDAFREAARLFKDSKSKMQEQLAKIEVNDEKQMVERLIDAADNRQELCKARIALEEARLLDKEGNLSSASEKYGLAADMFTKIKQGLTAEQDRKEIELMITLSKAWEAMAKAEAKSSPELYEEGARFFDEAKNLSPGDKATNLAMGHSRFCKALQAGVKFSDTGDLAQHEIATDNLESAGKYYLKAGLESASEYARASKLLFDAYVHMSKASKEEDHEKKTKYYALAEKILQASASSYDKADQPGKKEQVLKLLAKVQQDKELAISLTEILRAPDVVSTTMAFSSPTPTYETAVGLDRFAHADIQANLIAPKKELKMDEDLILGIELVNAGRGPAQLIKLQDLLPKGFTLREEPGGYRMEDSYLNLRGKRLDSLKTEEINLVLKPTHRGQFTLKPRILYLDESGKYKSHEPEPMRVTVGVEAMAPADKAVHVDTREAAEARSLLAGLNVVTLSHYRIVGNYVRYGGAVCNALKDARQKMVSACRSSSPKRENYIIWAPSGSGKTYFVQEVAASLGNSVHYSELNLAKLDEAGFRSGLAELRDVQGPCLCLVDEVDAKPNEPWPYEALMPFLDASATEGARFVFVLAGSSGSSVEEMKKAIAARPKGSDILSRVPTDNEYSIPPMGVGDRLLVVLSQFRQAGKQMGHDVREVEKLGLYYVALNPRLSNARQLREFAVRCAERVLPSDDRLKYDSLFRPGDLENKLFWTQALQSASALVGTFLLVED